MRLKRLWIPTCALLLIVLSMSIMSPVAAQSNTIDDAFISVPSCTDFNGRIIITFTLDSSPDRFLSNSLSGISAQVGNVNGVGTHTIEYQFIPPDGTNVGDVLTVKVMLGTNFFLSDLDSYTFSFNCSTGEKIVGATGPITNPDAVSTPIGTPVTIDVAANDTDNDGNLNPASTTVISDPFSGTLINNHDGTFLYTPNPGISGFDHFTYKICDTTNYCSIDSASIEVLASTNQSPDCSAAHPSRPVIWPPNYKFATISIVNVIDPNGDPVAIIITSIFQDELVKGKGDGNTSPDGLGVGTNTARVRAERESNGNGRVYHIGFTANDGKGGSCQGEVKVGVPKNRGRVPVDGGPLYNSTIR
ncbi:MAG: cadherin-like domain-containing protein [Anaerolineae bacterium]|nr:cadherin-like domain-containing protein [Anaerolineae bacterium]